MTDNKFKSSISLEKRMPLDYITRMPNCGIVAMATCAGLTVAETTQWWLKNTKQRGNWRGSTRPHQYPVFLRAHGVWFVHVTYDKRRVRTIGDFATWGAKPGVLYAIRSAGHMMVCCDGYVADQHGIYDVSTFWKRNARLKDHWEIIGR